MKALLVVFLLFLIFSTISIFISISYASHKASNVFEYVPEQFDEFTVIEDVQKWRKSNGLDEYKIDASLCKYAEMRLNDISINFSHDAFLASRSAQIYNDNQQFQSLAENLSSGINPLPAWINSPTHLKNLKENYQYTCVKCKNNNCVQLFAR